MLNQFMIVCFLHFKGLIDVISVPFQCYFSFIYFHRDHYHRSYKPYVVFVCSTLIIFIIIMPSSLLGIIYVEIMREFQSSASEAALMQSLFRGISFGGGKPFNFKSNTSCCWGFLGFFLEFVFLLL